MPFTCSVCGERHDERLLDIRLGLPDAVHTLDGGERAARTWLGDDFAVLDDARFFVRGLLELPLPELGDRFAYGAWVEVQMPEFRELLRSWHEPEQFAPVPCALANELAPYRDTTGLAATLRATSLDRLPAIELHDAPHRLVAEQRRGIDGRRADELAAVVAHAG